MKYIIYPIIWLIIAIILTIVLLLANIWYIVWNFKINYKTLPSKSDYNINWFQNPVVFFKFIYHKYKHQI